MYKFYILVLISFLCSCQSQKTTYGMQNNPIEELDLRDQTLITQGSAEDISRLLQERTQKGTNGQIIILKSVFPEYPKDALAAGIEGVVAIEFTVNTNGRVDEPKVIQKSIDSLNQASIRAIKKWRFAPILDNGKPVKAKLRHSFKFLISPD
jgi:TonB family protein